MTPMRLLGKEYIGGLSEPYLTLKSFKDILFVGLDGCLSILFHIFLLKELPSWFKSKEPKKRAQMLI